LFLAAFFSDFLNGRFSRAGTQMRSKQAVFPAPDRLIAGRK
jgi:hypothetical protein